MPIFVSYCNYRLVSSTFPPVTVEETKPFQVFMDLRLKLKQKHTLHERVVKYNSAWSIGKPYSKTSVRKGFLHEIYPFTNPLTFHVIWKSMRGSS